MIIWRLSTLCALGFCFVACKPESSGENEASDDDADTSRPDDDSAGTTQGTASGGSDTGSGTSAVDESAGSEDTGPMLPPVWGFLASPLGAAIAVFDAANNDPGPIIDLLPDAEYPFELSITPDRAQVWTVGANSNGVAILDAENPAIIHQAPITTEYPVNIIFDDTRAFVSGAMSATLTVIDRETFEELEIIPTPNGRRPGKGSRNPCTGHLYLSQWFGPGLMTYDPETDAWNTLLLDAASELWAIAVDPAGDTVYVLDQVAAKVHVFDVSATGGVITEQPVTSIDVCDVPWALDLTRDGSLLAVACLDGRAVHLIDVPSYEQRVVPLQEEADARSLDFDEDEARIFVSTGTIPGDDGLFIIDVASASITGQLGLGIDNPNLVALTPQANTCSR